MKYQALFGIVTKQQSLSVVCCKYFVMHNERKLALSAFWQKNLHAQ